MRYLRVKHRIIQFVQLRQVISTEAETRVEYHFVEAENQQLFDIKSSDITIYSVEISDFFSRVEYRLVETD